MDLEDKIATFNDELALIKEERIKKFITHCIGKLPNYFFEMPSSMTGKYHPAYALGKGGLVRHTKAAVKIAESLLQLQQNRHLPHDLIIAALILHDGIKQGTAGTGSTVFEHPLRATEFVQVVYAEVPESELTIKQREVEYLMKLISCHMGQWNASDKSDVVLPLPQTGAQKFVHMCDYLASRKFLTCEVE